MKNCLGFWTMLKERLVSCFEELFLFFPFHPLLLLHESLHKKPLKTLEPLQKIILDLSQTFILSFLVPPFSFYPIRFGLS